MSQIKITIIPARFRKDNKMEKHLFTIPNISCGHCIMAIKNELTEIQCIVTVEGNPAEKQITVEWDAPLTVDKIRAILKDINYPATA